MRVRGGQGFMAQPGLARQARPSLWRTRGGLGSGSGQPWGAARWGCKRSLSLKRKAGARGDCGVTVSWNQRAWGWRWRCSAGCRGAGCRGLAAAPGWAVMAPAAPPLRSRSWENFWSSITRSSRKPPVAARAWITEVARWSALTATRRVAAVPESADPRQRLGRATFLWWRPVGVAVLVGRDGSAGSLSPQRPNAPRDRRGGTCNSAAARSKAPRR